MLTKGLIISCKQHALHKFIICTQFNVGTHKDLKCILSRIIRVRNNNTNNRKFKANVCHTFAINIIEFYESNVVMCLYCTCKVKMCCVL